MKRYGLDFADFEGNMIAVFVYEGDDDDGSSLPETSLWDAWQTVKYQPLDGDPITDRLYAQLESMFAPADKRLEAYAIDLDDATKALAWKGIALQEGEGVATGIERLYMKMREEQP